MAKVINFDSAKDQKTEPTTENVELQEAAEQEAPQQAPEGQTRVSENPMVRKVQERESMIVPFSVITGKPFVICDPETFDDEVWILENEEQLKTFAKPFQENKVPLRGVKFLNKDFLRFFSSLFLLGVNKLAFVEGENEEVTKMDLNALIREPDYSKLPPEKRPVTNPALQLTGIYFMQEVGRLVPNEEKKNLRELEEELAANMIRSRYLIAVELQDGPESTAEKLKTRKYNIPILKDKNTGNTMQPAFTDPMEFANFAKGKKLAALTVNFDGLSKALVKEANGYMLNPNGYHILMPKELLENLQKRFQ